MQTTTIVKEILNSMQTGWNNGDGAKFAKPFAPSSQFVDIRGTLHSNASPEQLAQAHNGLFQGLYKGSKVKYTPVHISNISKDIVLVNAEAILNAPSGPMAGTNSSTISLVIDASGDDWKIKAFHNTLKMQQ